MQKRAVKHFLFLMAVVVLFTTSAQRIYGGPLSAPSRGIIITYAGNGTAGDSGDGGPATSAEINLPFQIAFDSSGNLYLADSNNAVVRRVDAATGIITTVAGNGTAGFSGDGGPATLAELNQPRGVAFDATGDLYISEFANERVRMVAAATGIITTIAGNGTSGYSGDGGPATSAELFHPEGIALDSAGNLYIADQYNSVVRAVSTASGIISTYAGNGTGCAGETDSVGDGCPATSAMLSFLAGITVDGAGNVYIADSNDSRVRKVGASTGIINTVAGNGTFGYSGDGGPATSAEISDPGMIAFDSAGNFYFTDYNNNRVRQVNAATGVITTIAGTGTRGYSGDGGPATSAELNMPVGMAVDAAGNIYVGDYDNNRVREVGALVSPTSLALSSSANPAASGETVTFTAMVSPSSGPTGTVAFTADGSTLSGCGAVALASGAAQCATSSLAAGSHTIDATYSGDSFYSGSSGTLTQVVSVPVSTGTFSISAKPPEIEVIAGDSANYVVTLDSLNGFFGDVTLSCSGAPADGACSFAQSTLTLTGRGSASTTLTVTTTTADARRFENWNLEKKLENGSLGFGISIWGLCLLPVYRQKQRTGGKRAKRFLTALLLLVVAAGLFGCGCPTTKHQSFIITITGTSSATGSLMTQSTAVELVVH